MATHQSHVSSAQKQVAVAAPRGRTLGVQRQRGDAVLLLRDVGHRCVAEAGQVSGGGGAAHWGSGVAQVPELDDAIHAWRGRQGG